MKPVALLTSAAFIVSLSACNTGNVGATSASSSVNAAATVHDSQGVFHISNSQLQTLLDNDVTLIDIRRPEEWTATGVVPGSEKLTFFSRSGAINPQLVPALQKIASPDQPVALICRTGNRTRVAAQIIKSQLGYTTVYNVEDGITRWISEGRAVVK